MHILHLDDSRVRWDTVAVDSTHLEDDSVLVYLTDGNFSRADDCATASARVVRDNDYVVVGLVIDPMSITSSEDILFDEGIGFRDAYRAMGYYRAIPQPNIEVTIGG